MNLYFSFYIIIQTFYKVSCIIILCKGLNFTDNILFNYLMKDINSINHLLTNNINLLMQLSLPSKNNWYNCSVIKNRRKDTNEQDNMEILEKGKVLKFNSKTYLYTEYSKR